MALPTPHETWRLEHGSRLRNDLNVLFDLSARLDGGDGS